MELLSSMRFAIALLTVICIVSAIGTVLKQGEPLVNYVDQFGPFWADVFGALGLFRVYSTPWFLIILAFLVLSTSLCIARNLPKILVDVRTFKEHIREQSLQAFHHRAEGVVAKPLDQAQASIEQQLSSRGWKFKTDARAHGVMIGARQGAANKIGYLAAHGAIVLICLGGLFDGDLIVKVQAWMHDLQPFRGGTVTDNSRLSVSNPAYRAQLFVPEGQRSASAVLNLDKGMLLQPLWPAYGEALARGDHHWVKATLRKSMLISTGFAAAASLVLFLGFDLITGLWLRTSVHAPAVMLLGFCTWAIIDALGNSFAMYLNGAHVVRFQVAVALLNAAVSFGAKVWAVQLGHLHYLPWVTAASYIVCALVPYLLFVPRHLQRLP